MSKKQTKQKIILISIRNPWVFFSFKKIGTHDSNVKDNELHDF